MPSPKPESRAIEETVVAAEVSAEHAAEEESAAAIAHSKALNDAQVAKERDAKLCPNCHGELIDHGTANPHKVGARHCNSCGACWAPGLKAQRAGHTAPPPKV